MSQIHVVKNPIGGWDVRPRERDNALSNHARRDDAVAAAEAVTDPQDEIVMHDDPIAAPARDSDGLTTAVKFLVGSWLAVLVLIAIIALVIAIGG